MFMTTAVAAAFLSGGVHDLRDEAGVAVDKIGVLAVFEKAQITVGVDALGRVLRTDLVAVFLQKSGDERPLLVADAGLSVENEGDRRQRYAGSVGDFAHFHPQCLLMVVQ